MANFTVCGAARDCFIEWPFFEIRDDRRGDYFMSMTGMGGTTPNP